MRHPDMVERGYHFVPGTTFTNGNRLAESISEFLPAWPDLPADPYIVDRTPYRFRRHSRVVFDPDTGEVTTLPHGDYLQSVDHNPLFGGVSRRFEPVIWGRPAVDVLTELVRYGAVDVLALPGRTLINIHLVRITAGAGEVGEPAPEGPHRDGFNFISITLMDRDLDEGGVTSLLGDDSDEPLESLVLQRPMDSLFVDDRRLRHYTTPIAARGRSGYRDVILMSYEPAAQAVERPVGSAGAWRGTPS